MVLEAFLRDLLIIFSMATLVSVVFSFARFPTVVGYMMSGVIVGPYGLGFIKDIGRVEALSEVGLIFLLFSIGVELSLNRIAKMKWYFLGSGSLQVFLTIGLSAVILKMVGVDWDKGLIAGAIISLSSTAIILKALHQRRELNTPFGNISLGVLLFQDLMAVPMMLLISIYGSNLQTQGLMESSDLAKAILIGAAIIISVVVVAKYIMPIFIKFIAIRADREILLLFVIGVIFVSSWFCYSIGLSLALGAFIAGILISESPYGHQVTSDIISWRDPLVALFFVTVGMMLDTRYLIENLPLIATATAVVTFIKITTGSLAAFLIGAGKRTSTYVGLLLCQVGEFSLVLAQTATQSKLITESQHQLVLSVAVLTMAVSPFVVLLTPRLAPRVASSNLLLYAIDELIRNRLGLGRKKAKSDFPTSKDLQDHVVIIGFGQNGQNLATILKELKVPYQIIEANPRLVTRFKNEEPIHFGDAAKTEILNLVNINSARLAVIVINDPQWINKVLSAIRAIREDLQIIVRLQYIQDEALISGIENENLVVAEQETAKAIADRVIQVYNPPKS